jgi:hypothetical protein
MLPGSNIEMPMILLEYLCEHVAEDDAVTPIEVAEAQENPELPPMAAAIQISEKLALRPNSLMLNSSQ